MDPNIVPIVVGIVVIVLFGGAALVLARPAMTPAEQRLDDLSGRRRSSVDPSVGALMRPHAINLVPGGGWAKLLPSVEGLNKLYEQAEVGLPFNHFLLIAAGLAVAGGVIGLVLKAPLPLVPIGAGVLGATPFLWLVMRKRKRIKMFTTQMPDALELIGRALRAGHGLASGLSVVADEMPPPIAHEFGRVFEEQNLGIPMEEALRGLAERVPSMDVRFFVTAVVIQRATGGDLAEVLDKIGRIIRERFQILGQVQALTAEGRLSGVILLAMPPSLLAIVYYLNPGYTSLLFTTDVGNKLLAATAVLQILGAIAIKKIITIKV